MRSRESREASRRARNQPRDELGRFRAFDEGKSIGNGPKAPKERRHGREPTVRDDDGEVMWDGSGDRTRARDLDRRMSASDEPDYSGKHRVTVTVSGEKYRIPVDDDGYVLWDDLVLRFMDVSRGGSNGAWRNIGVDLSKDAETMIEPGKRILPEDIAEWWAHPNMMDIVGIDDATHGSFSTEGATRKGAVPYLRRIAKLHMSPKQVEMVNRTLSESFTNKELKTIIEDKPCIISVEDITHGAGSYNPGDDIIRLKPGVGVNPVTVTHEANHRLKYHDRTRKGVTASFIRRFLDTRNQKYRNLEEAENTLETLARTTPYSLTRSHPSYYAALPRSRSPEQYRAKMDHDRELITGNSDPDSKGMRGKRLTDSINRNFDRSEISKLRHDEYDERTRKVRKTETAGETARSLSESD